MDTTLERDLRERGVRSLEAALRCEGFRVARPGDRRRGDLLVSCAGPDGPSRALPVRVHAARDTGFRFDREDEALAGLVLAYVWHLDAEPRAYLLGVEEARRLAGVSVFYCEFGHFAHPRPGGQLLRAILGGADRWAWLHDRLTVEPAGAAVAAGEPLVVGAPRA